MEEANGEWDWLLDNSPTAGNIDIDKLDSLPARERLWEKDGHGWRSLRWPPCMRKARSIFKNSTGRSISDIRKKITPLLRRRSFNEVVNRWSTKVLFFEDGTSQILDWYGAPDDKCWDARYGGYQYVDTEDMLRYVSRIKKERRELTWQQHYANVTSRKRRNRDYKKDKRTRGLVELAMINNPTLRKFYNDTCLDYGNFMGRQERYDQHLINPRPPGKFYIRPSKPCVEDTNKMLALREIINQLQAGNYTAYYRSPNYLHSIGKECPHFDNP